MRRTLFALTIALSALIVCTQLSAPQSTPKPDSSMIADGSGIARLTSLLLGEWRAPACGVTPPAGDFIWFEGGDYCEWPATSRGKVGAQRDEGHRVRIIRLDRQTTGEANARAVIDSIGTSLRSWGMAYRDCGGGRTPAGETRASLWERADLVFYISEITPSSAPPRLIALAVDNPRGFPEALCRSSAQPPTTNQNLNPNYPRNDIPVTLPSGTVVHVRNVVVLSGKLGKTLTLYIQTPTPQDKAKQVATEASELVGRWSDFAKAHGIDEVIVAVCRAQACLETREIATEMFRFDRQGDGTWKATPLDAPSKPVM